ncbi:MAG TPA: AAA family ATPase [Anaerolineales bacterium]|jgi:cell division protease FtsH|nr:AAA family ATPase [Anaerolineales bacterium]
MSATELSPQGADGKLVPIRNDQESRKARITSMARASTDFYGAIGWFIGLILTLFVSLPIIWFVTTNASRANRADVLALGIAIAWWLNPLSLGALGYVLSNLKAWRLWTVLGLIVWAVVNSLVTAAILSNNARIMIFNGLLVLGYILLALFFLYIQLRVFLWAASGRPARFFFGIIGWGALNALIYWAIISPEVLNIILVVLGFVLQIVFAIAFAVIQFVAIFWFMAQSRVEVIRPGDPKQVTFDDYKGQPNLIKMVRQWISLLSDRAQFQKMGGQFINGLLLYGEPGTGKTLLAKAMAGEAGIAFISIEGSGFRAMFWGVDVLKMIRFIARARKLAREYGACIAYIDEIDAVGTSRGGVMGGQGGVGMGMGGMMGAGTGALTRLLYEMDGINELSRWEKLRARWYQLRGKPVPPRDWHILFMGSTNRPDVLDPALTRPGRFDRTVVVSKPDRAGRREMVKYYLNKVKTDESVDIEAIVSDTSWATPARIMSAITKDAVRLALFDGRERVAQHDIELAFQEQAMGLENPIEEMEEDQRRLLAYHEAGHAVVQHYVRPEERIVRVSIIRRSEAFGYVLPVPNYDMYVEPLRNFLADILVSMAGHVSAKVFTGEFWTGATGDFQNVRRQLWQLAHFGYFGPPIALDNHGVGQSFSDKSKDVEKLWHRLEELTTEIILQHSAEVHAVAQALLERNDLTGKECISVIRAAAAANNSEPVNSELLLKSLVDETIVHGKLDDTNGKNGKSKAKRKTKPKAKVKSE